MFSESRHVGREEQTVCSMFSSPLFLFPFLQNLLLREQSLALPSGGAGGECGRNKLEDFCLHVALNLVSSVAPTLCRDLRHHAWEEGRNVLLCCADAAAGEGLPGVRAASSAFIQTGSLENERVLLLIVPGHRSNLDCPGQSWTHVTLFTVGFCGAAWRCRIEKQEHTLRCKVSHPGMDWKRLMSCSQS